MQYCIGLQFPHFYSNLYLKIMSKITTYPFYIRLAFTLISVMCISYIFYIGKDVIIPVLMAFLFAVLLLPVSNFLTTKIHLPHILAVSLTVLLFILIIIAIFTFISYEITDIANDFDRIKKISNFSLEMFTGILVLLLI